MTKKQQLQNNNSLELPNEFKRQAIEKLYQGKPLKVKDGIFSGMIKDILETALSEELNQHLAQEKQNSGHNFNNRKNGHNSKTLKTTESSYNKVEIWSSFWGSLYSHKKLFCYQRLSKQKQNRGQSKNRALS